MQRDFVSDLEKAAAKANQEVLFNKVASQVGRFDNPWLIFSKYIDAVNENCVNRCCLNGKIGLEERSSSCQPIALLWLNLEELTLQYRHCYRIVRLYTNDCWSTYPTLFFFHMFEIN
jgi:hypothetical protein